MNNTIQTILLLITIALAVGFLIKKFIWKPKKNSASKSCGNDGCGCH